MRSSYLFIVTYFRKINWTLLMFLVLVVNVKMPVKIAAVLLFLLLNRKMFFQKWIYHQKFIWFYFSMIAIAIINLLINVSAFSLPYILAQATGIVFWLLCIAAALINSWYVSKSDLPSLHATVSFFFILNALVTIGQLVFIMADAGSFNPYLYQGMHQKYFIGTGDLLTGISLDVSTTNAILNAFGLVYFLGRSKMILALLSMSVLLLTASNLTNILLLLVLVFLFIFQSNRNQKSIIAVCIFLLMIFMIKISPQNNNYITSAYKKVFNKNTDHPAVKKTDFSFMDKPDSLLLPEEKKQKIARLYLDSLSTIKMESSLKADSANFGTKQLAEAIPESKPVIPKPSIHTEPFQRRRDTSLFQKELLDFAINSVNNFDTSLRQTKSRKLPGKLIAFRQTIDFLGNHPVKIITGNGMGNFSSKLAFRTTGLKMAGGYPLKMAYINNDFMNNHLNLYFNYFSKDIELHSLVNSPNAVYDQLLAEYGLVGLLCFFGLYLGFFLKKWKAGYGVPLLLILLGAFWMDYWFEQLSIVIIFEVLMLINSKEGTAKNEGSETNRADAGLER